MVDALGNPIDFRLTAGQAHDLQGADAFLPDLAADTLLADKAFDADARVIELLAAANKVAVIPSRSNRTAPRHYDKPRADSVVFQKERCARTTYYAADLRRKYGFGGFIRCRYFKS